MPYIFDPLDLTIQEGLTSISIAYKNNETIWREVAPLVKVDNLSDFFYIWDETTDFMTHEDTLGLLAKPMKCNLSFLLTSTRSRRTA